MKRMLLYPVASYMNGVVILAVELGIIQTWLQRADGGADRLKAELQTGTDRIRPATLLLPNCDLEIR